MEEEVTDEASELELELRAGLGRFVFEDFLFGTGGFWQWVKT